MAEVVFPTYSGLHSKPRRVYIQKPSFAVANSSLLTIEIAGKQMWVKGTWNPRIIDRCVAVIGSRRMTEYGRRVVEKLVPQLVEQGWTIVSGFMYGVDQAAHQAAMECGGKTVAVLGWGIEYPITNDQLPIFNKIIQTGGLVISEWEKQEPTLWTFPMRNKIVAALSRKIYVVEAAVKSGALITVDFGIKMKKEIWAVPGPITSKVSEGTNKLIAEGKAKMWLPGEIVNRSTNNTEIYSLLESEALTVDELVRKTGRPADELGAELTIMMLKGDVEEKGGKYYICGGII